MTIGAYQKAIELEPDYAWYYFEIARVLYELGQYGEALSTNTKAIELESDNAWFYHQQGIILCGLKRYNEAVIELEKAIELEPNDEIHVRKHDDISKMINKQNQDKCSYTQNQSWQY